MIVISLLYTSPPYVILNNISTSNSGSGSLGLVGMTKLVFKEEGINGFYGGVLGVMIGQGNLLDNLLFENWILGPASLITNGHNFSSNRL
jgi:hypothetical protein